MSTSCGRTMASARPTACLLHNEPATYFVWQDEGLLVHSRSESESEQGVQLHGVDPKPSDLSMARVKRG